METKADKQAGYRAQMAKFNDSRCLLYLSGIITEAENDKIHKRIGRFQDKHKIGITREQLNSVETIYTGG